MFGLVRVTLAPGLTFFCKISPLLTLLIERLEEALTVDNLRVVLESWERPDETEDPVLALTEARDFIFLSPILLRVESLDLAPLDLTPCKGGVVREIFLVLVLALMDDRLDMLLPPLLVAVVTRLKLDADFDCGFKSGIVLLPPIDNCEAFPLVESGL